MASVLAFFLMASGYTMLEEENSENQWVPKNHPYIKNDAWLKMNKPKSKVSKGLELVSKGLELAS